MLVCDHAQWLCQQIVPKATALERVYQGALQGLENLNHEFKHDPFIFITDALALILKHVVEIQSEVALDPPVAEEQIEEY